jgi:hypothetical protein
MAGRDQAQAGTDDRGTTGPGQQPPDQVDRDVRHQTREGAGGQHQAADQEHQPPPVIIGQPARDQQCAGEADAHRAEDPGTLGRPRPQHRDDRRQVGEGQREGDQRQERPERGDGEDRPGPGRRGSGRRTKL